MKLFCYVKTVLNGVGSIRIHWEGVKGQHYIESFSHTGCQKIIVLQGCHHRTPWFDILHFGRCWFKSGVISNLCAGRKVFFGQEPVPSTMHVPEENSAGVTNTMKPSTFKFQLRNGEDLGYSTDCQPGFFCTNRRGCAPHFVFGIIL